MQATLCLPVDQIPQQVLDHFGHAGQLLGQSIEALHSTRASASTGTTQPLQRSNATKTNARLGSRGGGSCPSVCIDSSTLGPAAEQRALERGAGDIAYSLASTFARQSEVQEIPRDHTGHRSEAGQPRDDRGDTLYCGVGHSRDQLDGTHGAHSKPTDTWRAQESRSTSRDHTEGEPLLREAGEKEGAPQQGRDDELLRQEDGVGHACTVTATDSPLEAAACDTERNTTEAKVSDDQVATTSPHQKATDRKGEKTPPRRQVSAAPRTAEQRALRGALAWCGLQLLRSRQLAHLRHHSQNLPGAPSAWAPARSSTTEKGRRRTSLFTKPLVRRDSSAVLVSPSIPTLLTIEGGCGVAKDGQDALMEEAGDKKAEEEEEVEEVEEVEEEEEEDTRRKLRGLSAVGLLAMQGAYSSGYELRMAIGKIGKLIRRRAAKMGAKGGDSEGNYSPLIAQIAALEDVAACWSHWLDRLAWLCKCNCLSPCPYVAYARRDCSGVAALDCIIQYDAY